MPQVQLERLVEYMKCALTLLWRFVLAQHLKMLLICHPSVDIEAGLNTDKRFRTDMQRMGV